MSEYIHTSQQIKNCPCCDAQAQLKKVKQYFDEGYRIECTRCHIGTTPVIVGVYMHYQGIFGKSFTTTQAIAETLAKWNCRVPMQKDTAVHSLTVVNAILPV